MGKEISFLSFGDSNFRLYLFNMKAQRGTIPDFRNNVNKHPHVVILGAGASLAACPKGDKYGKKLPLMNSLIPTLGLEEDLKELKPLFGDFEKLYTTLHQQDKYQTLRKEIERKTYNYFYSMEVPDTPNLYDYLILSLRKKDVIATFNWDPLLLQSWRKHVKFMPHLPHILFLHGNVAVGTCRQCGTNGYMYTKYCSKCGHFLIPTQLLYPVTEKEYNTDLFIKQQWNTLHQFLEISYYVTIFGYSAPKTDVEARKLMLQAIQSNRSKAFAELDIIDIMPKEEVEENWHDFFYSHHYGIDKYLQDNQLFYYPRRSCDAHASAYLMNSPWSYNKFPSFRTIFEMHRWIAPLIEEEIAFEQSGKGFKHK